MSGAEEHTPIRVRIVASDVPAARPARRKKRTVCNTYTTSASDGLAGQQILPEAAKRIQAVLIFQGAPGITGAATAYGWIAASRADVQNKKGIQVNATLAPVTIVGQSQLWLQADPAASTTLVVSVIADYEA